MRHYKVVIMVHRDHPDRVPGMIERYRCMRHGSAQLRMPLSSASNATPRFANWLRHRRWWSKASYPWSVVALVIVLATLAIPPVTAFAAEKDCNTTHPRTMAREFPDRYPAKVMATATLATPTTDRRRWSGSWNYDVFFDVAYATTRDFTRRGELFRHFDEICVWEVRNGGRAVAGLWSGCFGESRLGLQSDLSGCRTPEVRMDIYS